MNKLNEIIQLISNDPKLKRFKELEAVIEHNEAINERFKELIETQKQVVKKQAANTTDTNLETKYNQLLNELNDYPLVSEYLDYIEDINNDLQLIESIIEQEIAKDITD